MIAQIVQIITERGVATSAPADHSGLALLGIIAGICITARVIAICIFVKLMTKL